MLPAFEPALASRFGLRRHPSLCIASLFARKRIAFFQPLPDLADALLSSFANLFQPFCHPLVELCVALVKLRYGAKQPRLHATAVTGKTRPPGAERYQAHKTAHHRVVPGVG